MATPVAKSGDPLAARRVGVAGAACREDLLNLQRGGRVQLRVVLQGRRVQLRCRRVQLRVVQQGGRVQLRRGWRGS